MKTRRARAQLLGPSSLAGGLRHGTNTAAGLKQAGSRSRAGQFLAAALRSRPGCGEPAMGARRPACTLRAAIKFVVVGGWMLGGAVGQQGRPTTPGAAYPVTYQLNRSTIIMACNYSGLTDPSSVSGWGIVSVRAD